ncbi:Rap1a/Tai family immunity protein [Marinobacter caseinilyticus]|uniref:Rap1a/Tai family immunity protein n=1 Tax=Marinobacter caseinilyticus TaxID=2692195 RepID=UPI003D06ABDA
MKRNFMAILMISIMAVPVIASASDAELLLDACKLATGDINGTKENLVEAAVDVGFCFGYIRGLSDYSTGTESMTSEEIKPFQSCRPRGVNNKQLARIVVNFLERNPQHLHREMTMLVSVALQEVYPCR